MISAWKSVFCLVLLAARRGVAKPNPSKVLLPPPTGKYNVGATKRAIPFYNENDPSAPGGIQSEYLATIYYPTLDRACKPKPIVEKELAEILEAVWEMTPGTMRRVVAPISWEASFLPKETDVNSYPILLFGPGGYGPPTDCYHFLLTDLASHGWVVVGLDHPWEQPFLRFPNGTGLTGVATDFVPEAGIGPVLEQRANDTKHFMSVFPSMAAEMGASFNTSAYAKLGHSVGGADAATARYLHADLLSMINIDGAFFERANATEDGTHPADVGIPSFLFGSSIHVPDGPEVSWHKWALQQSAKITWAVVKGTEHVDFSDGTFWKTFDDAYTRLGPIDGLKMVDITRLYVREWFEKTLLGKDAPHLEGRSEEFPEVTLYDVASLPPWNED